MKTKSIIIAAVACPVKSSSQQLTLITQARRFLSF